jgi:hypothetical protein
MHLQNALPVVESELDTLNVYASALVRRHATGNGPGEIIDASVVFLDIVDSTGLTERFAALGRQGTEQLASLLDDYFSSIFATITEYGGDVTGMDGDSVMALWWDEPGERAVAAAMALQQRLAFEHRGRASELRQRIVVTEGRLRIIPVAPAPDRRLLVVSGESLRTIEAELKACAPGQVQIPHHRGPWETARLVPRRRAAPSAPVCSDEALAPFLPRVIADRVARGQNRRIAEFRTLTSIMVRLDGLETDIGAQLNKAAAMIQRELTDVGLTIFDLLIADKGTVVKFVAGLPPGSMENNARGAVEAARRVLTALAQQGIGAGIGVATGRTFVGEVGNASRRVLAMIGPAMGRSARLMQTARGQVLCDAATVADAGDRFVFGDVVPVIFKGSHAPQAVWRLLGRSPASRLARDERQMFGREAEIVTLTTCLERMARGEGGLVVIEAEAGAGKSRLLTHGHASAQAYGYRSLFGAAQALEEQTPYFAFRQVLSQRLGGELGRPLEPARATQRLLAVLDCDPLLTRAEVLTDVLPLDTAPFAGWRRMIGAARPIGVSDLFVRLLRGDGGVPPPVLFLDDVHWLDASSARLLGALLRRLPGLLVIVASRPADAGRGAGLSGLLGGARSRLVLGRLGRKATGDLIRVTLGCAAVPRRLIDHIYARSEGLPLHAEQLALAMLDRGLVRHSPSGARVEIDVVPEVEVETLRDVIVRRLDLLPPAQQELLRLASILGLRFETALLEAIHPDEPGRIWIDAQLAAIEEAGLIGLERAHVAFRHVRIQEVIYDLLPFHHRRALHRRAAQAMEEAYVGDLDAHCARLAAHWEHSGDPARGATYRMRAAKRAMEKLAHHEVLAHLRVVEQQGGHAALLVSDVERAEYARIWGIASEELGDFATARHWLSRCAALSGIPVRSGRLAVAAGIGAEVLLQLGMRCGLRLRSRAAIARDSLSAQLHLRFAEHAYYEGDAARLLEVTLTALNRAESGGAIRELATSSGSFALGLGVAGLHGLAAFYGARAMEVGRAANLWEYGMAHLLNGVRLFAVADWPAVEAMTSGGAKIFRELGERDRYASCQLMTAFARIAQCDIHVSLSLIDEFGKHAEDIDNAAMRDFALVARSLVELLSGDPAERVVDRLREIRDERLSPGEAVLCRGIEAAAAFSSGNRAQARASADLALALTERHLPSISIAYHGVVAMAATQQALAATADAAARARAAHSMLLLGRFARRTPVSRPYAYWLAGCLDLRRRPRHATGMLLRGLQTADRLGMPFEAALCHRALASAGWSPSLHAKEAEAILERTGAHTWIDPWLLRKD